MKIVCSPSEPYLKSRTDADLRVLLFSPPNGKKFASCGRAIKDYFQRRRLFLEPYAWDVLSFALSVNAADFAVKRTQSSDGWTRQIDLEVAVNSPEQWMAQRELIERMLQFLSVDVWRIQFLPNGFSNPIEDAKPKLDGSCVTLISGGLDSFIGAIDLVQRGEAPVFVSQIVHGDREKQSKFVKIVGEKCEHIQINHNFTSADGLEPSQRARSVVFLAYATVASTLLKVYGGSGRVSLYVCENGLISINPPLTEARIGSLSTRTTHPYFVKLWRELLEALGFKIKLETPYQFKTKGEMLKECRNQTLIIKHASATTSCGRFTRNGFQHCGRCIPCLIRRSAFLKWGGRDTTKYVYRNLRINDAQHAGFDDVRSASIAIQSIRESGFTNWFGSSNAVLPSSDRKLLQGVAERGMVELEQLLKKYYLC